MKMDQNPAFYVHIFKKFLGVIGLCQNLATGGRPPRSMARVYDSTELLTTSWAKNATLFLNNSVKSEPILINFGTWYPEEILDQEVTNLSTSL